MGTAVRHPLFTKRYVAANDRIILDEVLTQKRAKVAPTLSASEFFEVFTAEQALKDYDLSYEEIEAGIVGDGGDGGIDGLYVFANGELVQDDTDLSVFKKQVDLELVVLQAKTSPGFSEAALDRFAAVTEDLLDLSHDLRNFRAVYNADVLAGIERFRRAHHALASRFPAIRFTYVYASRADELHPNVERKAETLKAKVTGLFSAAAVSVNFLGANSLLTLARRSPRTSHTLTLAETPISSAGEVGFVCLVRLRDYHAFITENGALLRHLFEANVRDYQGSTQVNEEIQSSLAASGKEDFWWLNNGITVIASKATQSGKALNIEDPQIVNGLQTSTEVFKFFAHGDGRKDERTLLVRVIVPTDPASRDRIIKATNSQTYIPPASLRATDKIHRDIEEYLAPRGLYYDRRKNYYKNEGMPLEQVVGIPYMAQAVMAIALQRPDNARSRPSSLLKKDEDYRSIFNPEFPVALYGFCAGLLKRVEAFLREDANLSQQERGNIRFHVAMHAAAIALGKVKPTIDDLAKMDYKAISSKQLAEATAAVHNIHLAFGATDAASKGAEFLEAVQEELRARVPQKKSH